MTGMCCFIGATAQGQAAYGQGTGDIILDNVGCVGTEESLFQCPHNGATIHNCAHSEDAGVTCAGTYIINSIYMHL